MCVLVYVCCRYLDSVTNKDSTLPPIPHLHSLLTDNGEPHPEVDIFKLVRSSYEVCSSPVLNLYIIKCVHVLCVWCCMFADVHCDLQKFGYIRADVIEQMRFKQRLRVIQTIEDTTKRNVVIRHSPY